MNLKKISFVCVLLIAGIAPLTPGCGCGADPLDINGNDAIMLSTFLGVTYYGGTWVASGPSAAANVIYAPQERLDSFIETSDSCVLFENITFWDSEEGVSPIILESSLQQAVATWYGSNYSISGLAYGPVFADNDTLRVSHQPEEGPEIVVEVDAPPLIVDPNDHLGEPDGLATLFSAPDGEFDVMFVYAYGGYYGEFGVMCATAAEDMTLDGTDRTAPLLDEDTIAEIEDRGWELTFLNVAYYNVENTNKFFSGMGMRSVPVQAGQMLSMAVSNLAL